MSSVPKIAVVYPASIPWMGQFLDGIRRFSGPLGGWRLYTTPPALASTGERTLAISSLVGWQGDGVIAVVSNEEEAREARLLKVPIVNISSWEKESFGFPRVGVDNFQAGRLAADHLLSRGLKNLAFIGWDGVYYSDLRRMGFIGRARELGSEVSELLKHPNEFDEENWGQRLRVLSHWIHQLPKPCGVFAVHDYRAQLVIDACDVAGVRVPQDVAVIGMDNDVIICRHSMPTITSISRNSEEVGWQAAALLHRLMEGDADLAKDEEIRVPPECVVARESTDTHYHGDEVVRVSIRYIENRLRYPFNVEEVANHVGVSKRKLEMRFRDCVGKSPHQFITEARVARARELLNRPGGQSLQMISENCGFVSYSAFVSSFKRVTGVSPKEARNQKTTGEISEL
ncbi:DNA-binding transcriptional regulator [Roseibacillus persicicus]|uniref:AraC family transcriptional regulator n=1 Tax=Roseibacillus persicicus TaxID=454148 RepID=UPI00398AEA6A